MAFLGKPWLWFVLAILVVTGLLAWPRVYQWANRKRPADLPAAMQANNRGVGCMERFDYKLAVQAFDDVAVLAPDWLPARINLGIALLNTRGDAELQRALEIFQAILRQDERNPYANFCLGIIFQYQGKIAEANPHFAAVTEIDPADAHAWYNLGATLDNDPDPERNKSLERRQRECYERAVARDPYLRRALYGLQQLLRLDEPRKAEELRQTFEALNAAADPEKQRYGEMGRYAEVIGRIPNQDARHTFGPIPLFVHDDQFAVKLKAGARWATGKDVGEGPAADLRRRLRERFGATLVVLDYNQDGKPDLFLVGAVVEDGKVRDLLLRNDGTHFTDVTHEAGLAEPRLSLGCTVADFDNDGTPDLFITGIGRQWLFRNSKSHRFEDVTAQAGLDRLTTVCLGACFVDLDQDADMDLVVAEYAADVAEALDPKSERKNAGIAVYLNVGESKQKILSQDPPPLRPRFKRMTEASGLERTEAAVALIASDLDRDGDPDLVVLADGSAASTVVNDRLLRFRRAPLDKTLAAAGTWNGGLVLDANHHGRSDLFLIRPDRPPAYLVSKRVAPGMKEPAQWFEKGVTNSPTLLQAQAVDLDYDGWTDIVGLSDKRVPVFLQNQGGKLVHISEGLGSDRDWPRDLVALATANVDGDKYLDLLAWSESKGLLVYHNRGNENQALKLDLSGHRRAESAGGSVRCNADGFGTRVVVQTEDFWTGAEYTTLSAGMGQSRQPLVLGLAKHSQAEVVRLRWPDNCWQAELNQPACHVIRIDETNRKPDSCPVLFAWDGRRFGFVADFLGGGALGEAGPDGTCRQPRPEESVKIEAQQLMPKDGFYLLKVAEPMDEVTYLDHLELAVVDHPSLVRVYPDERFVLGTAQPTQDLLAFRADQEVYPVRARDHKGREVTTTLRHWDRDTVAGFARRSWTGFAEEHWVELEFGDRLSRFGPSDRLVLCLAGWTDYPYPESVWAAQQAGVSLQVPVLERLRPDGSWEIRAKEAGFPAGLPRMTTLDVTGKLTGPRCTLRLRTNMHVFWDQIFVAPVVGRQPHKDLRTQASVRGTEYSVPSTQYSVPGTRYSVLGTQPQTPDRMRATTLAVSHATLEERGCVQEFSPDGRQPTLYDYHRLERVPVTRQAGRLTRFGNVTELLQAADDRFVIFGPGDDVTVRFDAGTLPKLPAGWTRSFVLRTRGYCKGCGPFIVTGDTVGPLPFRAMKKFPYGPEESYPRTQLHVDYLRRYNTREVGSTRK
jgi:tetratricopeptide (TPR) repeat protein